MLMKRKEKPKQMIRKQPTKPPEDKFNFAQPFGGMTPYPPENCPGRRFTIDDQGIKWVDNYYCATICRPKYCKENREYRDFIYKQMGKEL